MKNIEIITAHNITVNYELATIMQRIGAFLIDLIITLLYVLFIAILFGFQIPEFAYYLLIAPVFMLYHLISENILGGQSLGKKVVNLKVVKIDGSKPSFSDYLMRWAFRLIDIGLSSGSLAIIAITSSDKNQRVGDLLAQTVLVKLRPNHGVSLHDLVKIHSDKRVVKYQNAGIFSESDMLFIKELIVRVKQHPNNTHHLEVLNKTVLKTATKLGLSEVPTKGRIGFLSDVLKDYVALTR